MLLWSLLLACSPSPSSDATPVSEVPDIVDDGSLLRIDEGTPEAFGVLALLNDAGTDLDLLDLDVGLDIRAARALIAHRDGPDDLFGTADDDLFDTIEEADDQYYVGDSALGALLDYALANGWVPSADDVVGSWEGVTFTAEQVEATLLLANTASEEQLDIDVALDRRAAANIVNDRPILDMDQLADVAYVGRTALTRLRDAGPLPVVEEPPAPDLAGLNEMCTTNEDCEPDLKCLGAIAWGSGLFCVDTWGVFSYSQSQLIPDDGTTLTTSVDVQGLATVPVDVVLTIDVAHDRLSDLTLEIDNFNGYGTTLWNGSTDAPAFEMVVYAFPSDDMVHGLYNVHLTDNVPGVQGELLGWDLLVVSNYD